MSDVVIKIEHVSKQYRLGRVSTKSLAHDINRWWHTSRGKEDPYLKLGEVNDRTKKSNSEYVWSLKDISFDVHQGDVLGVIGKNGAGKSTLLKILSQVTRPTTGKVKIKGRIASLLEVGTGFHPELTGRENIFLNGAILGMSKQEIRSKFDEIVSFSGIERYIDTPVKRYSSGMYVRLAFAVAAHLEPEILIVDEVLAVGDAEFQRKCLGKMKDVSSKGRTILFVSHNMASLNQLCNKGIMLQNGSVLKEGSMNELIPLYLSGDVNSGGLISSIDYARDKNKRLQVLEAKLVSKNGELINKQLSSFDQFFISVNYAFHDEVKKCNLTLIIQNEFGETIWFIDRTDYYKEFFVAELGEYNAVIQIPNPLLKAGTYFITIGLADSQTNESDHKFSVLKFAISEIDSLRQNRAGFLFNPVEWPMNKVSLQ